MEKITLYHGSIHIVNRPICTFGRENLDFGKGFYLSDIRDQAEAWAKRIVAVNNGCAPVLNKYTLDKKGYIEFGTHLIFSEYNEDWLRFIVDSRLGRKPWTGYDYIEGGVANDRVIDTVNLFIAGLMDMPTALNRLSLHRPNNQICLLNQELTDKYLTFEGYEYL